MKFGIYSSIANPPRGEDLPRCVDEVIEESRLAEQAGFDSCFFGEHHQDKDGFLPSPLIVCTAVAASTTKLRVGTSVILLPLHHPVRLAEDVVTLDVVSKGRVTVGVGLGYQPADFQAFGVSMSDRVELLEEKVIELDEMDYDEIKNVLGVKNDFCIYFEDVTGDIVKIDDIRLGIGSDKIYINGEPCG